MPEPRPTALVTRAREDAGSLCDALGARGFAACLAPLLRREVDAVGLRDALSAHPTPDVLLLTSPASAAAVAANAPDGFAPAVVAAVGPGTERAAQRRGLRVDVVSEAGTGVGLVAALGDLAGRTVLYPRARVATAATAEALDTAQAKVIDVVAYDNRPSPEADAALAAAWPVDVVTLLSSSAARRLVAALERIGSPLPAAVVVIGPSTRATATELGLNVVAEAQEPTVEAVAEAAAAWWRTQRA